MHSYCKLLEQSKRHCIYLPQTYYDFLSPTLGPPSHFLMLIFLWTSPLGFPSIYKAWKSFLYQQSLLLFSFLLCSLQWQLLSLLKIALVDIINDLSITNSNEEVPVLTLLDD